MKKINADQQLLITKLTSITQFKYFNLMERLESINEADVGNYVRKKRKKSDVRDEETDLEKSAQVNPSTSSNNFDFTKTFASMVNKGLSNNKIDSS